MSSSDTQRIAVVGMHAVVPGAEGIDAFWSMIRDGVEQLELLDEATLEREGVSAAARADPHFIPAAMAIDDIEMFDAPFFEVSPKDAAELDPQIRRFLEGCWSAFDHAGIDPHRFEGSVGVYAGSSFSTYLLHHLVGQPTGNSPSAFYMNQKDAVATYVSYKLGLCGPSVSVQTACSTSLVAAHVACQALLAGECDLALAGGVSINIHQRRGYRWEPSLYFSPDGHTRTFDEAAKGTVFGSGLGVVLLRRLEDALAAGDDIHAVILGSAINNDGAEKAGFYAPSAAGQAAAISEALAVSGVDPTTIGYVEAHGTGTELGDVIEVEGLTRAYGAVAPGRIKTALGSVKTLIGHLDIAAGVVGLIKTCLVLRHGVVPPLANFTTPNPRIDWENAPFSVDASGGPWPIDGDTPRRAAVSSLGIGGTNCHIVLEAAPARSIPKPQRQFHLLTLSARSDAALERLTDNMAIQLRDNAQLLAPIAFTLQNGRAAFAHRRTVVAESAADAAAALVARDPTRIRSSVTADAPPLLAFVFPGGGAQYTGMGAGLYQSEPVFRQSLDESAAKLAAQDINLLELLTARDDQLDDVLHLQVALFAVEHALATLLATWGLKPSAMIGHSLGEYVAAVQAGVFEPGDALELIVARGKLMRQLPPAAMLAVLEDETKLRRRLSAGVQVTAVNAPEMLTVSGPVPEIDELARVLKQDHIAFRRVRVGVASHTSAAGEIAANFAEMVARVPRNAPRIPFASNVTGDWITAAEATDPHYWALHMTRTVRFADGLRRLAEEKPDFLVEVGPNSGLVTDREGFQRKISTMHKPGAKEESGNEDAVLMEALGSLWRAGAEINWGEVAERDARRRIALPGYPFERKRYWIKPPVSNLTANNGDPRERRSRDSGWFWLPSWRRLAPAQISAQVQGKRVLLLANANNPLAAVLREALFDLGTEPLVAGPGWPTQGFCVGQQGREEGWTELASDLASSGKSVHCVVDLFTTVAEQPDLALSSATDRLRAFLTGSLPTDFRFVTVCCGAVGVDDADRVSPDQAAQTVLCRVAAQEFPGIDTRVVDIPSDPSQNMVRRLASEILDSEHEPLVAIRRLNRWGRDFDLLPPFSGSSWSPRTDGTYLLVGCGGPIGRAIATRMLNQINADGSGPLIGIMSRNPSRHPQPAGDTSRLRVFVGDAADPAVLREVVEALRAERGRLDGVIHAAGITDEAFFPSLREIQTEHFAAHFRAKAAVCKAISEVTAPIGELQFVLLLSSLAAHLGGIGHVAYSAANAWLDAFARSRADTPGACWISLNSELWSGSMPDSTDTPVTGGGLGKSLSGLTLTPEEGVSIVEEAIARGLEGLWEVAVSTTNLVARERMWRISEAMQHDEVADGDGESESTLLLEEHEPPEGELEEEIMQIWADVLGYSSFGRNQDFFSLGGHSLKAISIVAQMRSCLGLDLGVPDLFRHPTVRELAAHLETEDRKERERLATILQQVEANMPSETGA